MYILCPIIITGDKKYKLKQEGYAYKYLMAIIKKNIIERQFVATEIIWALVRCFFQEILKQKPSETIVQLVISPLS